jgi:parallel beta-helix repeat protein
MSTFTRFPWLVRSILLLTGILLPLSVEAQQPVLSLSSLSVNTETTAGTNAPSRTVQLSNTGSRALKWTVVQSSANWLSVSPNKGTNSGTLTITFQTTGLAVGSHQATFRVESTNAVSGSPATVTVVANILQAGTPPPTLTITCPAIITATSPDGNAVPVTYSASTTGGNQPVTVVYSPASGSNFSVGTTTVTATATSGDGQKKTCTFDVTVTDNSAPPPPVSGIGPQSTITCPAGAVNISPGTSINPIVDASAAGTTFCFTAGVHNLDRSIIPKTGNTFVGQYGAILNGTWTSNDDTQAAFRAYNQDIDNVTIKNLVIKNFRRGIHASAGNPVVATNWTIEYNEIGPNYSGVVFPSASLVRNNYIHHNTAFGYFGLYSHNSVFESNEVSYNGWEQKITESANVTVRNNFIHHNIGAGIWYDANNTLALVEGNRLEDNGHVGIWYEISSGGTIRNNTIRRSADAGVFISTSKDTVIHNNLFEDNFRGITYFVNCASVDGSHDLATVSAYDNAINISSNSASGSIAAVFSYAGACTALQVAPYKNGQKALTFTHNAYDVVSPGSNLNFYWDGFKLWSEWQALGHDTTGTVQ